MKGIISEKIPFVKKTLSIEEAEKVLMDCGRVDRCKGLEHRTKPYITVYNCDGFEDYFYGYMVPDTSYLKVFKLMFYRHGLILVFPHKKEPSKLRKYVEQKKLFNVFSEHKKWGRILGVSNVADLNCIVKNGNVSDFIRVSEALHEKKIAKIADMICEEKHEKRVVLISGPSSSGKTTFAQRLSIQLRVNGVRPKTISLDNYFLDRKDTPLDQNGDYDFECIEAIDTELFNKHLAGLIEGKEILVPVFNFKKGCREEKRNKLKIDKDQMLIIEGIHGLNEKLSASVHRDKKFKIYVSALTSLNIDEHNRIPTTDTRFIRRIVRDFQFRGSSATNTIQMWPSVRRGEERNIFPFQEDADIMFNTALIYELGVLKSIAENLLVDVSRYSKEYSEAKRLIEFLRNFVHIDPKDVPMNSLLREFVGDGCFR